MAAVGIPVSAARRTLADLVDGLLAADASDVWHRSGEVGPTTDELAAELGFDLG